MKKQRELSLYFALKTAFWRAVADGLFSISGAIEELAYRAWTHADRVGF